jgi:hypothetical protein
MTDAATLIPSLWGPALQQPSPTNTWPLGGPSYAWSNLYLGSGGAPVLDPVSGNIGYYKQTTAEIAAGVTPGNYAYAPSHIGDDVRRYGNIDLTGATDCRAILNTANSVGVSLYFPPGTYRVSSNLTLSVACFFDQGAILKPDATAVIAINAPVWAGPWQIFNLANQPAFGVGTTSALVTGLIRPVNAAGRMHVEWTGAVGDGVTDDTLPLQYACMIAQTANCIGIQLQAKTYKITAQIGLNGTTVTNALYWQSGTSPSLYGVNYESTKITCAGIGATSAIITRGGSGTNCGAVIEDLTIQGDTNTLGLIEFSGRCGMRVRRINFNTANVGLYYHNADTGAFTEYCVAENCLWNNCTNALNYNIAGGAGASFNGSGVTGAQINTPSTGSPVVCYINSGALPYNAPFSAQVWANISGAIVFSNQNASLPVNFYGSLTTEEGTRTLTLADPGGFHVAYCGTLNCNGEGVRPGLFELVRGHMITSASGFTVVGGTRSVNQALTTGANTESAPPIFASGGRLIHVAIEATGYDYRALLYVTNAGTGGGAIVSSLAGNLFVNTAGYGAPTFSGTSTGALIITNAGYPASGVVAYLESQQLCQGFPPSATFMFQM